MPRGLRVVQVSFHRDARLRSGDAQLRAWPTLHGVAEAVARADVEVTVVQPASHGQTLRRNGVTYAFVADAARPSATGRRMQRIVPPTRIVERVRAAHPEVLHVQGFGYPLAVWHLARAMPCVPMLVQDHASSPPRGARRMLWRLAYGSLRAATFTSRQQAVPFLDAGALRRDLPVWEVVEGSCDFTPGSQREARRVTGLGGDPCMLWTGRLDANKDPLTVLDAFRRAAPRLPDARLWCCFGDAPLLGDVQRYIAGTGVLRERVTLLGRRPHDEMEAMFRAADLFVQMSHREGSGYSVIEALACGTPPLVSDIPPLRAIVGGAGSLTPLRDAGALASAMVGWSVGDRAARRRAARARFECALSFDAIGQRLREVYSTLAGSP